ncbi:hypothetical protein TPDSLph2_CDS0028 [Terrisporobacter phage TPDSL_ph2]
MNAHKKYQNKIICPGILLDIVINNYVYNFYCTD